MAGFAAIDLALPTPWPDPLELAETTLEVTFDGHRKPYRHVFSPSRLTLEGTTSEGAPYVATRVGHAEVFVAHFAKNAARTPTIVDLLIDRSLGTVLAVERSHRDLSTHPFNVQTLRGSLGPFTARNLIGAAPGRYPPYLTITLDGDTHAWTLELSPLGRIKSWRQDAGTPTRWGEGRIMQANRDVSLLSWEHTTGTCVLFLDNTSSAFFGTVFFVGEDGDLADTSVTGQFTFSSEALRE